jgi:hypothetical protein
VEKYEGKNHLEYPGVDGKIILKWKFRKWDGGMDWIDLAEDMGRWRALLNVVMIIRFPFSAGNFLTS